MIGNGVLGREGGGLGKHGEIHRGSGGGGGSCCGCCCEMVLVKVWMGWG